MAVFKSDDINNNADFNKKWFQRHINGVKYYSEEYSKSLENKSDIMSFGFNYKELSTDDALHFESTMPYVKNNDTNYENPFKLPVDILNEATKNYKFVYNENAIMLGEYGLVKEDGKEVEKGKVIELPVVPSMFNPLYGLNIVGITKNMPLSLTKENIGGSIGIDIPGINYSEDLSDCSIKTLVEESKKGNLGRGIYKYSDFMYCKNLGKISNNRLITLRRFPVPIGDDIWHINKPDGPNISGDIGRLVTWMDDTNRLEDILKYNYSDSFVKREARFQDKESRADGEGGGILAAGLNLINPPYRNNGLTDKGNSTWGADNMILNAVIGKEYLAGRNQTDSENKTVLWDRYDDNRIYEPKQTIRETHLYEGKLSFEQNFSLTFDYELRAYENINPRTAFLDLLNNIQQVTYRKGTFWGGAVWWKGAPENVNGWKTANAFIDKTWDGLTNTLRLLASGQLNISEFFGGLLKKGDEFIGAGANMIGEAVKNPEQTLQKGLQALEGLKVGDMLKGMIKNKLGRPALYATNSILTGEPVGLWHVTIGNPRNPILVMGNLIIDNASIQHYGPLGLDDFPTGIKVTVNLKHAKPRDMTEIGKMYTMGSVGLGVPLSAKDWENFINNGTVTTETRKVNKEVQKKNKNNKVTTSTVESEVEVKRINSPNIVGNTDNNGHVKPEFYALDTNQVSTMWASSLPSKNPGTKVSEKDDILNKTIKSQDNSNKA